MDDGEPRRGFALLNDVHGDVSSKKSFRKTQGSVIRRMARHFAALLLPQVVWGVALIQTLGPSATGQNRTGRSVSIGPDGRVTAIGSGTGPNGVVTVYERRGSEDGAIYSSGLWVWTATLMAPDPKPQFNPTEPESIPLDFGYAVAVGELRSEWLVVGAPGSRRLWSPVDPPRNDVGRVFVYHRDPSSSVRSGPGTKEWQYMASFEPGSDSNALATGNRFGACVAIAGGDGNRMAVGAPGFDEGKGAVTLFSRVGKSWAAYRRITASEPSKGALFGYSIAIGVHDTRPSVVVIGAPGSALDIRDSSGAVTATLPNCGKVFLYEISGVRADEANDSPFSRNFGDGEANMRYGTSIAVGNSEARLVVVGAPGVGRVFMLRQSAAGNWANEGGNLGIKAKDEEECTAAHCVKSFGTSVAILSKVDVRQSGTGGGDKNLDGNYILVGAPLATIGAGREALPPLLRGVGSHRSDALEERRRDLPHRDGWYAAWQRDGVQRGRAARRTLALRHRRTICCGGKSGDRLRIWP